MGRLRGFVGRMGIWIATRAFGIRNAGGWAAAFHGASTGRLFGDWGATALHPDLEIRWSAKELRARARDLVRNTPYAMGIVEAFADNIIGEGIRLKPTIKDPSSGQPARETNWEIERGWQEWGEEENASVDARQSWLELQRLIVRSWVTDGEVFIRRRKGWSNRFAFAVQVLDPDLLDESFNERPNAAGVEIRMGVEMDADGRRLAYHFFRNHPSENRQRERVRIPAQEITHFFVPYRAGQTRGFSLFAPVLTTVKMIDGMLEAELVASRTSAAKMGTIKNMTPEAIAAYAQRLALATQRGEEIKPRQMEVAPGLIEELLPGQEFEGFDPTHPNTAFEPFLKVLHLGVARAFSISYLTFTGDVSAANYSSMRAGLVPERDHWKVLQALISSKICRPTYRDWISMSLLTGALDLPSPLAADYQDVTWRGRRWQWVDPLGDVETLDREIALGVNSRQRAAADRGFDYETLIDETAEDERYAKAASVDVSSVERGRPATAAPAASSSRAPNGNGNGANGKHGPNRIAPYQEQPHGD